jgi:hypothetical protein
VLLLQVGTKQCICRPLYRYVYIVNNGLFSVDRNIPYLLATQNGSAQAGFRINLMKETYIKLSEKI